MFTCVLLSLFAVAFAQPSSSDRLSSHIPAQAPTNQEPRNVPLTNPEASGTPVINQESSETPPTRSSANQNVSHDPLMNEGQRTQKKDLLSANVTSTPSPSTNQSVNNNPLTNQRARENPLTNEEEVQGKEIDPPPSMIISDPSNSSLKSAVTLQIRIGGKSDFVPSTTGATPKPIPLTAEVDHRPLSTPDEMKVSVMTDVSSGSLPLTATTERTFTDEMKKLSTSESFPSTSEKHRTPLISDLAAEHLTFEAEPLTETTTERMASSATERVSADVATGRSLEPDVNNGTGRPFGSPFVTDETPTSDGRFSTQPSRTSPAFAHPFPRLREEGQDWLQETSQTVHPSVDRDVSLKPSPLHPVLQTNRRQHNAVPLYRDALRHRAVLHGDSTSGGCKQSGYCERLPKGVTCFGAPLPYEFTSRELTMDLETQKVLADQDIAAQLRGWSSLRFLPSCWPRLRPFICSLLFPPCTPQSLGQEGPGLVSVPSHELCSSIRSPCSSLPPSIFTWPRYTSCYVDQQPRFPSLCENEATRLEFPNDDSLEPRCPPLTVPTNDSAKYIEETPGCGLQCDPPFWEHNEMAAASHLIHVLASVSLALNLVAVASFLINWQSSRRYPALIVFYLNICWACMCVGWILQFSKDPGARQRIACESDGTRRLNEPSSGENLQCMLIFFLVYYFLVASAVWIALLAYSWHISFRNLEHIRQSSSDRSSYFHLVAWSLPLVLSILSMALALVQGFPVEGICFLSPEIGPRTAFLLAPLGLAWLISMFFLSKSLASLISVQRNASSSSISKKAKRKLANVITRLSLCLLLCSTSYVISVAIHWTQWSAEAQLQDNIKMAILCPLNFTFSSTSHVSAHESLCPALLQQMAPPLSPSLNKLHLSLLFLVGIFHSSWVWTKPTWLAWKAFYYRLTGQVPTPTEHAHLRKHKVIAQAFAKRQDIIGTGRLSISFHTEPKDPVDLDVNLQSGLESDDISSTWAKAIPQFLQRRGALAGAALFCGAPGSVAGSHDRRGSAESDYSQRRWSFESRLSRRPSLDSGHSQARAPSEAGSVLSLSRKGRRFQFRRPAWSRRGSISSAASNSSSQVLPASLYVGGLLHPLPGLTDGAKDKGPPLEPPPLPVDGDSACSPTPLKPPRRNLPPSLSGSLKKKLAEAIEGAQRAEQGSSPLPCEATQTDRAPVPSPGKECATQTSPSLAHKDMPPGRAECGVQATPPNEEANRTSTSGSATSNGFPPAHVWLEAVGERSQLIPPVVIALKDMGHRHPEISCSSSS